MLKKMSSEGMEAVSGGQIRIDWVNATAGAVVAEVIGVVKDAWNDSWDSANKSAAFVNDIRVEGVDNWAASEYYTKNQLAEQQNAQDSLNKTIKTAYPY